MKNFLDLKWISSHPIAQFSIAIALGAISFFVVVGPQTLDFHNISWLQVGDPATHYLGWAFFRDDTWRFPIGLNPHFGSEIATSIIFSDSIPLIAFLLKPFGSLLPQPFQYLGLWVLVCFCFQAFFGFQLSKIITTDLWIRYAIVIIFIFSPPMLARFGETTSLCAHFLILAALYLNLRSNNDRQSLWWILLLTISVLVHFYIFVLILALWLADLADRLRCSIISTKFFLMEIVLGIFLILVVMWQAGYFSVPVDGLPLGAYGEDALNLNALFNPAGWSYVFPSTPYFYHAVAGFNYLGLGVLLVMPMTFIMAWRHLGCVYRHTQSHLFLVLALLLMTSFSISNTIHVGSLIVSIALPTELTKLATIFRASGRIFWPVYYAIVFFCLYWAFKKLQLNRARVLVYLIAIIQVADTSAGWLKSKAELNHRAQSEFQHINRFQSSFWQDARSRYHLYKKLTPLNQSTDWETLAYLAQANKSATNSAYFARANQNKLSLEAQLNSQRIISGKLEPSALYFLENRDVFRYAPYIKESDLLAFIDGMNVLAPNWHDCATCRPIATENLIKHTIAVFKDDGGFQFPGINTQLANYVFISGWARPEAWGIWSEGRYSEIALPGFLNQGAFLRIKARALINQRHPNQVVEVFVNGKHNQRVILAENENNQILITLPKSVASEVRIGFAFSNPVTPNALGLGDDTRQLSIGITSLEYQLLD